MKRMILIICALLMVGCTANNTTNEVIESTTVNDVIIDESEVIESTIASDVIIDKYEVAEAFNNFLKEEDYDSLKTFEYSKEMETYLNQNNIEDVFKQYDLGAVIEQQDIQESEDGGFTILSTPTIFEMMSLNLNVVFDSDNKIVGFNLGQFTGNLESTIDVEALETGLKHHQAFADGDIDTLENEFEYSAEMIQIIEEGLFKETITSEIYGALVEVKDGYTFEYSGYTIVSIPVVYENMLFNYDLAFDVDRKIAGISFSDYAEKKIR